MTTGRADLARAMTRTMRMTKTMKTTNRRHAQPDWTTTKELPIIWSKKKRQLNTVNIGLIAYVVSVYVMLVTFVLVAVMAFVFSVALIISFFTDDLWFASFVLFLTIITAASCWCRSTFATLSAGSRPFFSAQDWGTEHLYRRHLPVFGPSILFLTWTLFHFAIIEKIDVSMEMLRMMFFFTFLLMKAAFYCSLVYIGRIASFMRVSDDRKPRPWAGLFVGGTVILSISTFFTPGCCSSGGSGGADYHDLQFQLFLFRDFFTGRAHGQS